MKILQKIFGTIFPPYKFIVLRKEQSILLNTIISSLPVEFDNLKDQLLSNRFFGVSNWDQYPDFKSVSMIYAGDNYDKYKKRGINYKISGIQIYSNTSNQYENIEILVKNNLFIAIKITNSEYFVNEFDFSKIDTNNLSKSKFDFPPDKIDIFYDSLDDEIKQKLNPDDLFDIDFSNRIFYAFHDMEDGNYLAVDKKCNVYSLVHDATPMSTKMKISFKEMLDDIENGSFNKEEHMEERYRQNK